MSNDAIDLIKKIHAEQGYAILTKGDVPGHEFHGNQYTEGGGAGETTHSARATDTNGKDLGNVPIKISRSAKGEVEGAKYKGKTYYVGRETKSLGNTPSSAPEGTKMYEMNAYDKHGSHTSRIYVTPTGSHVHED